MKVELAAIDLNLRKIFPVLVLVTVIAIITASCGADTAEPTPSPPAATRTLRPTQTARASLTPTGLPTLTPVPTLPVDENALRGTSIEFWRIHGYLMPGADGRDTMQELVNEFNQTNAWGLYVSTRSFNDYAEVFDAIQASVYDGLPNLILGYNYQARSLYRSSRLLVDLNPYLQDPHWGLAEQDLADFTQTFWEQEQDSGVQLGIPLYRSGQVLFYNQSWAEELGFRTPPTTPQEFAEQACTAARALASTEGNPPGAGGWIVDSSAPGLLAWIYAFGGVAELPDQSGYDFASPETREALAFLREMLDDGCAWVIDGVFSNAEFAGRQALFLSSSLTGLFSQERAFIQAGSADQWTTIPFPSELGEPVIVTYGPALLILSGEPEQELAAWLLARWLVSPESQARWTQNQGTFPTRSSVIDLLDDFQGRHPQWAVALELLPYAMVEPGRPSWSLVHFVLSDAGRYLFSPLVTASQISGVIETLAQTASELDGQFR